MNLDQLTRIFMWMTIINVAVLILSSVLVMVLRKTMCRTHARLFGITEEQVALAAYGYLGAYRLLVLVFNIAPYVALSLVG
ncbi:MAG: DUF6868 family protein [Planctomycetota bacterium]|jgi:hypothetical protein